MDDIYKEEILDHAQNPRNFGNLPGAQVVIREANASCGDLIEMAIKVKVEDKESKIAEIKFRGVGCAIMMAAASLLTEKIKNEKLKMKDLKKLTDRDMVEILGIKVSPTRMKCATLPLRAVEKALKEIRKY